MEMVCLDGLDRLDHRAEELDIGSVMTPDSSDKSHANGTAPSPEKPDLKRMLQADREARIQAFAAELEELKKKHGCDICTQQMFRNGQPGQMMIEIVTVY